MSKCTFATFSQHLRADIPIRPRRLCTRALGPGLLALLSACGGGNEPAAAPQLAAGATVLADPATVQVTPAATATDADPGAAPLDLALEPPPQAVALAVGAVALMAPTPEARRGRGPARPPAETPTPSTPYHLYVATTGSDANPGTESAPFLTITRAARAARPDTTVHVAPGSYRENVRTRVHGTAAARIRYVSDTKWGAKLIGYGTEGTWNNTGNFIDIIGFDVSGSGRLGILNQGSYTVVAGNHVHDLAVSGGCTGSGGAGIVNANYAGSDGDVIGNVVHDIGVPGRCNGVQGIYSSNLRGRIHNNIVYRASSWGIHLWHAANNVMVANNTVFANGGGHMGGGIVIGSGDRPGGVILNNTKVVNNIVYRNPAAGIRQYCYSGQSCIGDNNLVSHNLVSGNGSAISMRVGRAVNTIDDDPQFVDYRADGTGNYRLQSGSPAVNRGLAGSAPAADIDNVARPRGAAPDLGAYESE